MWSEENMTLMFTSNPLQVLLAGVRGYFWDFDRVTPFPVPSLLKNLPEDGSEVAPEDPASDNEEVRAALATGNLSLEAVPAPTTNNTSEGSDESPDEVINDAVGVAQGGSPTGSALHTEAVGVVVADTLKRTRERNPFSQHDSFNVNDSFMSACSSLEHLEKYGSGGSVSASTSGGEYRDAANTSESQQLGSPINPSFSNQTSPSGIVRGVFTDMSGGDSGAIVLPCPP